MKKVDYEKIVHQVLLENQNARNDDFILYDRVVKVINPKLYEMGFTYVMNNHKGLPAFETISRCRRRLQNQYDDLKASQEVEMLRTERELEFTEYYGGAYGKN